MLTITAFDRSAILREAYAGARSRRANNRAWRSYRQACADALRSEWRKAEDAAARQAVEAEEAIALPADVTERIAAIRASASYLPQTFEGHARFTALHDEADDIAMAARLSIITANRGPIHATC